MSGKRTSWEIKPVFRKDLMMVLRTTSLRPVLNGSLNEKKNDSKGH